MKEYIVRREKRENHPDQEKVVLYQVFGDTKIKCNVWKPGYATPKLNFAVPAKVYEKFRAEKEAIEAEELKRGIADY